VSVHVGIATGSLFTARILPMIQILFLLVGVIVISNMIATPEQKEQARQDVKKIEPLCYTIIVIGGGFLLYAGIIG
jgi:hypothetical protein